MTKVLGVNDDANFCECCGKQNLKVVVWLELDSGDIVHYGRICASKKWLFMPEKEIKNSAKELKKQTVKQIAEKLRRSPEHVALQESMEKARSLGFFGRSFLDFNQPARDALDNLISSEISKQHPAIGVKYWEIKGII